MAKRKKHEEEHEEEGGEAWLLPYSDLMTLLLAVFICLFAISNMDKDKAKAMAEAFSKIYSSSSILDGGPGIFDGDGDDQSGDTPVSMAPGPSVAPGQDPSPTQPPGLAGNPESQANLEQLEDEIDQVLADNGLDGIVFTEIKENGLHIRLPENVLFSSGRATLLPENQESVIKIGRILQPLDYLIRVEGHTDDVPMTSNNFADNWQLSSERARAVLILLLDRAKIQPQRLTSIGRAEFNPIASNETAEGRAENRRVEIVILNERYGALEESSQLSPTP
jgi:chemotaxis protein MotB